MQYGLIVTVRSKSLIVLPSERIGIVGQGSLILRVAQPFRDKSHAHEALAQDHVGCNTSRTIVIRRCVRVHENERIALGPFIRLVSDVTMSYLKCDRYLRGLFKCNHVLILR